MFSKLHSKFGFVIITSEVKCKIVHFFNLCCFITDIYGYIVFVYVHKSYLKFHASLPYSLYGRPNKINLTNLTSFSDSI